MYYRSKHKHLTPTTIEWRDLYREPFDRYLDARCNPLYRVKPRYIWIWQDLRNIIGLYVRWKIKKQ